MGYDIYLKERMLLQILYRNPGKLLSRKIYDKILKEHYPIGNISYDPEITNIQKFKLKKLHPNLSSFILDGVSGKIYIFCFKMSWQFLSESEHVKKVC